MRRQIPISARIKTEVLEYIKGCHQPVNSLINSLLEEWIKKRQDKELLLFQEETGTDELSQFAERHTERNSQSCKNCIYHTGTSMLNCSKIGMAHTGIDTKKFCCIYWERKKKERT